MNIIGMIKKYKNLISIQLILLAIILIFSSCSQGGYRGYNKSGFWYQVQKGDDLAKISRDFSVSMVDIQRKNGIYDPKDLALGMRIFIPAKIQPVPEKTTREVWKISKDERFVWPYKGKLSSKFGYRKGRMHHGIDIADRRGTKIKSAASGIVTFSGRKRGYGKTLVIDHGDGLTTLYAHNARLLVNKGERVRQGELISTMGSTGRSSGPHLHFEVKVNGKAKNPLGYLPK